MSSVCGKMFSIDTRVVSKSALPPDPWSEFDPNRVRVPLRVPLRVRILVARLQSVRFPSVLIRFSPITDRPSEVFYVKTKKRRKSLRQIEPRPAAPPLHHRPLPKCPRPSRRRHQTRAALHCCFYDFSFLFLNKLKKLDLLTTDWFSFSLGQ